MKMTERMSWKEARRKLQEMLHEFGADWSLEYKEAVGIGIERIEEVEDLELVEDVCMSFEYKHVIIEAVYPDGTVMVRNRFVMENAACKGEDPKWPRHKLVELASWTLSRWNETYGLHTQARLRLAK